MGVCTSEGTDCVRVPAGLFPGRRAAAEKRSKPIKAERYRVSVSQRSPVKCRLSVGTTKVYLARPLQGENRARLTRTQKFYNQQVCRGENVGEKKPSFNMLCLLNCLLSKLQKVTQQTRSLKRTAMRHNLR